MKRLVCCLSLIWFVFSGNVYAAPNPIQVIHKLAVFFAKAYELKALGPVLVVFDIDEVLLRDDWVEDGAIDGAQFKDLFSPQQRSGSVLLPAEGGGSIAGAVGGVAPLLKPGKKFMPAQVSTWVQNLTGVADVICLTARRSCSVIDLERYYIYLSGAENGIELEPLQKSILHRLGCGYDCNVISTSGNPKGPPLLEFYKLSATPYSSVIFVDDDLENVQSVVHTLYAEGINVWGFHFIGNHQGARTWEEPNKNKQKKKPFFYQ